MKLKHGIRRIQESKKLKIMKKRLLPHVTRETRQFKFTCQKPVTLKWNQKRNR